MEKLEITYTQYTPENVPLTIKNLLEKAQLSAQKAYAPYSKFHVGCAILLENKEIIYGNNQENAAYPSGICAERVAIFGASANHPKVKIQAIAIRAFAENFTVNYPITPCGACRQVLLEYQILQKEQPIYVYMQGASGNILVLNDVRDLLPFGFFEEKLRK
jgi:cytidine deaminase